jgi:Na+-translocating ferredoxin:NAD+ oxidoreductase subunit B
MSMAAIAATTIAVIALGAWVTAARRVKARPSVDAIDALLPQTQCGQCGYASCKPYAEALARGEADVNQCPPGGDEGARKLSDLLGVAYRPLNLAFGTPKPKLVARIDETLCIGCTLCIEACPVDAILGAAKQMHTVIAKACTGCELCLPPCPVDCIELVAADASAWREPMPQALQQAA